MNDHPPDLESPFGGDLWVVLGRYVSAESLPAEADRIRRWLAEEPRREGLLGSLDRASRSLAAVPPADLNTEGQWRRLEGRLDQADVADLAVARRRGQHIVALQAAAMALLAIGATVIWYRLRTGASEPTVVVTALDYRTRVGQADSLDLPDGTRVVLGPASHLVVAPNYGTPGRDVRLEGEALFDVRHDADRPFRVRAAVAVIEDLGTRFAVRDDGGEVHVVVQAGSVSLRDSASAQAVVLGAGDRGALVRGGVATVERAAATADDLAWTRGQLVFNGAPMSAVTADLKRWYGIELIIADPGLAAKHLTAAFAGEPAEQVLNMIGLALGASVERRGDTALVRAK
ncbi:MAG: FecR domain-containing protein [Gemmatimonadetes bacterium]|nr:FecR domain-containing protein [Gemmatimonadota bacterium]